MTDAPDFDPRADAPEPFIPPRAFLRECKRAGGTRKVVDSTGAELSGTKLLIGTLVMRSLLRTHVLADGERNVGVLLPPSVGGVLANAALAVDRRVAVNLNYTLSDEVANHCVKEAGLTHVLTSRKFLEKRPMDLAAEMVFLEDLKPKATTAVKLKAAARAMLPVALLERSLGLHDLGPDDLLTVIFTSGSTGEPKGVMLSQANVGAVVAAIERLIHLGDPDAMLGVLPFFHSFGYTVTLWWPLCVATAGVYHVNPLDARTVGKLGEKYRPTFLVATPTFLRGYLKRCEPDQLSSLDVIIVGGEKLPADLREAWTAKFGHEPSEGYGTTELSPVVSCNIPEHRARDKQRPDTRHGTVGRPLPGVRVKLTHPETGADLTATGGAATGGAGGEAEGLLNVGGPTVMRGYLNQLEKTAAAVKDGWYDTGDVCRLDADGFIHITGRQSRFSKIGGEMVPHLRIEEALLGVCEKCAADDEEGSPLLAVTAVPDERKGERIVVLHRALPEPTEKILGELRETGLPNLWLPDRDAFREVAEIPVLGTGKLDLRRLKELAAETFGTGP